MPDAMNNRHPCDAHSTGRALLSFADWIEDDFPWGLLRRLLQSGDVTLGDSDLSPGRAARLLVKARAAWGRETYRLALVSEKNRGTRGRWGSRGPRGVDGARPDYAVLDAAFEVAKTTFLAPMMEAARFANVDWKLTPKAEGPLET